MTEISPTNAADVLAAIPAGLGIVPTDSIIAVLLSPNAAPGESLKAVGFLNFQKDLTAMLALKIIPASGLLLQRIGSVILTAIWDGPVTDYDRARLASLEAGFARHGIPVIRTLHAQTLTEPAQWADLDTGESGPTYPHQESLHTARARAAGQPIAETKDAARAEFAEVDPPAPMIAMGDPMTMLLEASEELAQVLSSHRTPSDHLATLLGVLVCHSDRAFQALLSFGVDEPQRAAAVWTVVATRLRSEARTWALISAAIFHYLAGQGVRSGTALDVAADECVEAGLPTPRLVDELRLGVKAAVTPAEAREHILFLLDELGRV